MHSTEISKKSYDAPTSYSVPPVGDCYRGCSPKNKQPKRSTINGVLLHYAVCGDCGTWLMSTAERKKMSYANSLTPNVPREDLGGLLFKTDAEDSLRSMATTHMT